MELDLTINVAHPDYYQRNYYKITLEDLEILKNNYSPSCYASSLRSQIINNKVKNERSELA